MRFGVLNPVSDTETPFQTPFNTVFDNYGGGQRGASARSCASSSRVHRTVATYVLALAVPLLAVPVLMDRDRLRATRALCVFRPGR